MFTNKNDRKRFGTYRDKKSMQICILPDYPIHLIFVTVAKSTNLKSKQKIIIISLLITGENIRKSFLIN